MPKFEKGSQEAKDYMKILREKRGMKRGAGPLEDLAKIGNAMGKPFKDTIGVNPFTLGYTIGHDVIAPAIKGRGMKKPNAWVEFVRQWAKDNNTSYMCAVSIPECRQAYHAQKPQKLTKKQQKEAELQQKETELQQKETEQMGAEDIASTSLKTTEPAKTTVSAIFDLARKSNGFEKVVFLYTLFRDMSKVKDTTKLQYSEIEIPEGQFMRVPYPDDKEEEKRQRVNSRGTLFDNESMKEVQDVLDIIFAPSPFKIDLYHTQGGVGRKGGVRFYIKANYPPKTKTAKKTEDFKAFYDNTIQPLYDDKRMWIMAEKYADEEVERRLQASADEANNYYKSKGIDVNKVSLQDAKSVLKNILSTKNIQMSGINSIWDDGVVEGLRDVYRRLKKYKEGVLLTEFVDKLRQRTNTLQAVPQLPDWAKGLVGQYLGTSAPKEVKAMNPEQAPKKRKGK